jgi:hypothetical protein
MPAPDKPRHRSGYTAEETEQVKSVCLTVAVTLGAYLDDVCIVGGLVPPLLIDSRRTDDDDDLHPGTNDLDVGLALALLDDERYAEISRRLRSEGFKPDTNENGNQTPSGESGRAAPFPSADPPPSSFSRLSRSVTAPSPRTPTISSTLFAIPPGAALPSRSAFASTPSSTLRSSRAPSGS